MPGPEQAIRIYFEKLTGQLDVSTMKRATQVAGNVYLDDIQKRIQKGIGTDGSPFAKRKPAYLKRKAKLMRRYSGRYAAKSPNDWMRLSGDLFRNMGVKNVRARKSGKGLTTQMTFYIKGSKAQKKAEGLQAKRKVFWLPKPGTAARTRVDRKALRAFRDVVRVRLINGKVSNL